MHWVHRTWQCLHFPSPDIHRDPPVLCEIHSTRILKPKWTIDLGDPIPRFWPNNLTYKIAERFEGHVTDWRRVTDHSLHTPFGWGWTSWVPTTPLRHMSMSIHLYALYAARDWLEIKFQPYPLKSLPKIGQPGGERTFVKAVSRAVCGKAIWEAGHLGARRESRSAITWVEARNTHPPGFWNKYENNWTRQYQVRMSDERKQPRKRSCHSVLNFALLSRHKPRI